MGNTIELQCHDITLLRRVSMKQTKDCHIPILKYGFSDGSHIISTDLDKIAVVKATAPTGLVPLDGDFRAADIHQEIDGQNANDYPKVPVELDHEDAKFSVDARLLKYTAGFCSKDITRPTLCGVHVYKEGTSVYIEATDGYIMTHQIAATGVEGDIDIIVPADLIKLLYGEIWNMSVDEEAGLVCFQNATAKVIGKEIAGRFVDIYNTLVVNGEARWGREEECHEIIIQNLSDLPKSGLLGIGRQGDLWLAEDDEDHWTKVADANVEVTHYSIPSNTCDYSMIMALSEEGNKAGTLATFRLEDLKRTSVKNKMLMVFLKDNHPMAIIQAIGVSGMVEHNNAWKYDTPER